MSQQEPGDVIEAATYSVDDLRKAVFEGGGGLARPLALGLLSRKEYAGKEADLLRILSNEAEVPRLRAMAATTLSELRTPTALEGLERGLRTPEVVTLRSVVKALGDVGTEKHLRQLQELGVRPDPVGREAQRAASVLMGRLKAGGVTQPMRSVPIERSATTTDIRIARPAENQLDAALKGVPSRRLAKRGSISLECQGRQLIFAFDEDALAKGIGLLRDRGEIGIVTERQQVEGTGWEPRYRVSIEPGTPDGFKVSIASYGGRLLFSGAGQVEGAQATFHLEAADTPGAVPVDVRGRFDGQQLTFERALSNVRRRPPKQPTRIGA